MPQVFFFFYLTIELKSDKYIYDVLYVVMQQLCLVTRKSKTIPTQASYRPQVCQ